MDRNSVIGFVLLGVLFVGYIFFNQKQQVAAKRDKDRQDSIANINKPKPVDTANYTTAAGTPDSSKLAGVYGTFAGAANGTQQTAVMENKVLKITFSNHGGQPSLVQL